MENDDQYGLNTVDLDLGEATEDQLAAMAPDRPTPPTAGPDRPHPVPAPARSPSRDGRGLLLFGVGLTLVLGAVAAAVLLLVPVGQEPVEPSTLQPRELELQPNPGVRWFFHDSERGLTLVSSPDEIPGSAAGAVVVEDENAPPSPGVHFVANLYEAKGNSVIAYPATEADVERRLDLLSESRYIAGDVSRLAEIVALEAQIGSERPAGAPGRSSGKPRIDHVKGAHQ